MYCTFMLKVYHTSGRGTLLREVNDIQIQIYPVYDASIPLHEGRGGSA